jgi:hypothetical protein
MISILENQKAETRNQKSGISAAPDWWMAVPAGERALLHAIARILRSARRSPWLEVARAAAKWERGIGCFIKVRLINQKLKCGKLKAEMRGAITASVKRDTWLRVEGSAALFFPAGRILRNFLRRATRIVVPGMGS